MKRGLETGAEITVQRVERSIFPMTKKILTISIKGQTNDDHQRIIMTDRVPCGNSVTTVYYRDFMQNLRTKMHKNRPQLLDAGPIILHDNARPHIGNVVTEKLHQCGWEMLPHAPYSPDMSPPDFDLFPKLKQPMRGRRFPLSGRAFCCSYLSHSTDKQRECPRRNSKASHMLGLGH